ncbi:MAG: N-6 DNA methylase [Rhodocyclaceae bacterium]|nr:N-6 DNA methylase [Rhodocyclaceae bacterium]
MKKADLALDALRIEGSLLPAEFIQKLLELKADHQSPADYGIPPGLNLKDEIGRYWRIATALWADFKARSARADANPDKLALSHWLVPLFTRVLGFEGWTPISGEEIDERRFPLTHKLGATPLLLVPPTVDLDKSDARFAPEGRRRSPHATVQEYLNASHAALWGIVCNGHTLRLLRDNPSLTRPAYIEADLARIFEEGRYADFVALWLIAHGTRFGNGRDAHHEHQPILEHWHAQAQEIGERALEKLRDGVTDALRALGNGFLAHPANTELRAALADHRLTSADFFKQLLRLVYRLILLFTAEDRGLLHAPHAAPEQRELYAKGYSASLLRERALKSRADRHADLWQGLLVTFRALAEGAEPLGLPALGGLFGPDKCPDLDAAELSNTALLAAVKALCFFRSGAVLARINYRDMDTEELGSVYESLLELQPVIHVEANPWRFGFMGDEAQGEARGSARKLTGSYYTPDALVQELIQSALEPKIAEALKAPDPRAALLSLKVIDPACGSGHFLLAAARRIAAEVARLDAESDIPEALAFRHALREVVAHCIYGVDLNPLAVELCQTALWLETLEPGKPLGFLDHHVRHGNALIGLLDPALMAEGIPDQAYAALSGDDKAVCAELKKTNKKQAGGRQVDLFIAEVAQQLASTHAALDAMPEDTLEAIAQKRAAFLQAEADEKLARERLRCDLFCAAFFAPKTRATAERVPLSGDLLRAAQGQPLRPGVAELARELAGEYHFFHWHLAFPEVFSPRPVGEGSGVRGGFDVVLANPPWERIKLQEQEFFAARRPAIAQAANAATRSRMIAALNADDASPADKQLYRDFMLAKRGAEAASLFAHDSGRFPLTGVGDVNLYALFAETIAQLAGLIGKAHARAVPPAPSFAGRAGLIVPTGIATDDSTKAFFDAIASGGRIASLYDFENREAIFPSVHRSYKFCLLTLGRQEAARFVFFATDTAHLRDERRAFTLTAADIALLNPNTRTCPVFRSQADAELTKKIYRRVPVLIDEAKGAAGNPWGISFMAMIHMSNDSHLFRTAAQLVAEGAERAGPNWIGRDKAIWVPLYEAKMVHQFDHRWASYDDNGSDSRDMTDAEKRDPACTAQPRYWIKQSEVEARLAGRSTRQWLMGWRDICRSTDERTVIAAVVPRVGVGNKLPLIFPDLTQSVSKVAALYGNLAALCFDFVARQKIGGTTLNYFYAKQFPVLPPEHYTPADLDFIVPRVLELTYTAHDLAPFARDLGFDGPPFAWDPERRAHLRAELDAYYARLYGLTRDELRYILDPAEIYGEDYPSETFRVLKNNEIRAYGEYRTRRLVLAAWDRLFH